MYRCFVLMEPVNHSYSVPAFSSHKQMLRNLFDATLIGFCKCLMLPEKNVYIAIFVRKSKELTILTFKLRFLCDSKVTTTSC